MSEEEFIFFAVGNSGDLRYQTKRLRESYQYYHDERNSFHSQTAKYCCLHKLSVVQSYSDLERAAPWEQYSIPPSHLQQTLSKMRSQYQNRPYAFVIVEANKHISAGQKSFRAEFGVMYRSSSPDGGFFPTSHQPVRIEQGDLTEQNLSTSESDAILVAIGAVIRPLSVLGHVRHWPVQLESKDSPFYSGINRSNLTVRAPDETNLDFSLWYTVSNILKSLPRIGAGGLHCATIIQYEWPSIATTWTFKTTYPNGNVLARKASKVDAATVQALYADVDDYARSTNIPCAKRLDLALVLLARRLAEPAIVGERLLNSVEGGTEAHAVLNSSSFNLDFEGTVEEEYISTEIWTQEVVQLVQAIVELIASADPGRL